MFTMTALGLHDAVTSSLAQDFTTRIEAPPGEEKYLQILRWFIWAAVIATLGGFIVAAAMLAYQRWSGGGGDAQAKLVGAMLGAALISMAGTIINTLVF
ncbi:hypothetical protein [Nocardia asiatica]|uniref:hypothetical protein n=1 Tax=Nocardia asiatica TaxID=209252 RepID=UPI0002EC7C99|nr:hypothetical protein [Nocardia asiatica]